MKLKDIYWGLVIGTYIIWVFTLLSGCDFEPIPPTSTTSTSTTSTTLEAPKTGEVSIKQMPSQVGKRPFDYKIDSKGIGHLIVGEAGQFKYQTFNGAWSQPEILKDSTGTIIPYTTKDMRFRSPHIAILGDIPHVFWGEKESDGLLYTFKQGSSWNKPIKILGQEWIEFLNADVFQNTLYLASVTVEGKLTISKFNGVGFIGIKTTQTTNKQVNTHVAADDLWFISRFRDGSMYPLSNPDQPIIFKEASIPQAVIIKDKDYHAAYIVGATKKLNGKQYYWPDKIVYKSQAKEIVVHQFVAPTDAELGTWKTLSDGWLQVCGDVAITTIGGHVSVAYDIKNTLYFAELKAGKFEAKELGKGECPLIKQRVNSAELVAQGGFSYSLKVKTP